MNDELRDFKQFMVKRADAAKAYVSGDPAPLGEMVARSVPATFFGPGGGHVEGTDEVWKRYEKDAAIFEPDGKSSFEILQCEASQGLAFWAGSQKATVNMHGKAVPIEMELRVTEIFRREEAGWRMVHRHADMLVNEKEGS